MTGRILVVDDVEPNVRLLEAKLTLEYYEVLTASDGAQALKIASEERPDIILLDVMMPGMDGFEVCRRLKADPTTCDIPVVLVTALDGREDKIRGLEAGAEYFVTKPIDDTLLFAQLKSLVGLRTMMDELRDRERKRDPDGRRPDIGADSTGHPSGRDGRVLILDDNARQAERMVQLLAGEQRPTIQGDPAKALISARGSADLMIVNVASQDFDGLRLVAQIRSTEASRRIPIIAIIDPTDRPRVLKALQLGVNNILPRPIDPEELSLTTRSLIARKRLVDSLSTRSPAIDDAGREFDQRPAPYRFGWTGRQLHADPQRAAPFDPNIAEAILSSLRAKVQEALASLTGNHADPRMSESMRAFLDCISKPAEAIPIGVLLMRYRSLQADAASFFDPGSERERSVVAVIGDVVTSAGDLIALYPDIQSVEAARIAIDFLPSPQAIAIYQAEFAAVRKASEASTVVAPSVLEALAEGQGELDLLSVAVASGSEVKRQVAIQHFLKIAGLQALTLRNYVASTLQALGTELGPVAAESWTEAKKAIPRGVGKGVERTVSGTITFGLVYLVAALAGPVLALGALIGTFQPLAQRAGALRDYVNNQEEDESPPEPDRPV